MAVAPLLREAARVVLLSGTPAFSRPRELFTQVQAVAPNLFNTFHDFGVRYCSAYETAYGYDYSGSSNMAELQIILEQAILIRRKKEDVLNQLPAKVRRQVWLAIKHDKSKAKRTQIEIDQDLMLKDKKMMLQIYNLTAQRKVKSVVAYVESMLEHDRKFLVFCHHSCMMAAIQTLLLKKKVGFIRIDGATTTDQRGQQVIKFQNEPRIKVALLSMVAAGAGITLTAASTVIFAEMSWNPGLLLQCEDRVHRIGQQTACDIHYLLAHDTVDDFMWPMLGKKLQTLGKVGLESSKAETSGGSKKGFVDMETVETGGDKRKTIVQQMQMEKNSVEHCREAHCHTVLAQMQNTPGVGAPCVKVKRRKMASAAAPRTSTETIIILSDDDDFV